MLTNIRYILITALRDWLFIGLLGGIAFATVISATLGGTAFLEEKSMTLAFASGSSRLMLMTGLIVFVCFHIRNAFDTKEIDVILSRPISRGNLIFAYWLGFAFVGLMLVVPVAALVALISVKNNIGGFFGWAISLQCEAMLVVALALFSAFALRSAVVSVLACMGFYALSRMMVFFVMTSQTVQLEGSQYLFMRYVLQGISTVVPRLDFFAKSEWLVYGFDAARDWQLFLIQTMVFVPILLLATIADFRRRQF